MKIKKSKFTPASAGTGGAAIADRFKLDPSATGPAYKGPTTGKTAATCALVAGIISFGLIGILTFVLYSHWEYLMPA
ncbi:MAG: hypothetical protein ACI4R9_04235 [Kiritimatiellia bacterium]